MNTNDVHPALDTTTGKMKIRRRSDGLVLTRWPIDAKGMVDTGHHELVDPRTPSTEERLHAIGRAACVALCAGVGHHAPPLDNDHLVQATLALVENGTLTLPPDFHGDPGALPTAA